jgi:hypothetical protein
VKKALTYPMKLIASNAGVNGSVVMQKVIDSNDANYGYNAATDKFENLMDSGIIDPTKVRGLGRGGCGLRIRGRGDPAWGWECRVRSPRRALRRGLPQPSPPPAAPLAHPPACPPAPPSPTAPPGDPLRAGERVVGRQDLPARRRRRHRNPREVRRARRRQQRVRLLSGRRPGTPRATRPCGSAGGPRRGAAAGPDSARPRRRGGRGRATAGRAGPAAPRRHSVACGRTFCLSLSSPLRPPPRGDPAARARAGGAPVRPPPRAPAVQAAPAGLRPWRG